MTENKYEFESLLEALMKDFVNAVSEDNHEEKEHINTDNPYAKYLGIMKGELNCAAQNWVRYKDDPDHKINYGKYLNFVKTDAYQRIANSLEIIAGFIMYITGDDEDEN